MTDLYSMLETNTDETKNLEKKLERTEVLFDLETHRHTDFDTEFDENIICDCGSYDLSLESNGKRETITLNNHKNRIKKLY